MNEQEFRRMFPHATASAVARNRDAVGGVEAGVAEPAAAPALVHGPPEQAGRQARVEYRVVLVACRRRLLDGHDNSKSALKPLVDAIAATLGLDDADPRLTWEIGQVETRGEEGVLARVEKRLVFTGRNRREKKTKNS